MAMHDGLSIGPRLVDLAMDKPLDKTGAPIRVHGIAVQIVLDDVVGRHQSRRERSRHQISVGRCGMPQRDVTEAIDDALRREYAAGRGEIRNKIGGDRAAGFIRHDFLEDFTCADADNPENLHTRLEFRVRYICEAACLGQAAPLSPTSLPITRTNSVSAIGFDICVLKPASSVSLRSSSPAYAVSAIAGTLLTRDFIDRSFRINA